MDTESQKRFDEIVAKEPAALSEADVTFIRARRSYLTRDQAETFAELLEDEPTGPYAEEEAPKNKRGKKDEQ